MWVQHEWQECNRSATLVTRVQHEWHTSETSATRLQHKRDTSVTQTTLVRHECYTKDTTATRAKNFDFDNDTGKNIFSHPYIHYMASERLQGEEQFHTKNYLLEISRFYAKMRLKSAPQKLNFLMAKAISKSCTLDCSCKSPCTFSLSMKIILCENTTILFSKNY